MAALTPTIARDADDSPALATLALTDDAALELDLADDRRALLEQAAADFDPLGLYRLEQERDLAASLLADAFPDPAVTLTLVPVEYRHRIAGTWSAETYWQAGVGEVFARGRMPGDAAAAAVKAHRRANGRVRTHPEAGQVVAGEFEAFGRIDPADAGAFLAYARDRLAADFLTVEADGRVMLASGHVVRAEAFDVGQCVADFLFDRTPGAAAAEALLGLAVERRGDGLFKGFVILAGGQRVGVPGVCPSRAEARAWAERAKRAMRPTVATPVAASAASDAATPPQHAAAA